VEEIENYNRALQKSTVFKFVAKHLAEVLNGMGYSIAPDRDNFDYLYLTESLALLPGQKYYSKRKDIKKFVEATNGKAQFAELKAEHKKECLEINKEWIEAKSLSEDAYALAEHLAFERALRNYEELEFIGFVVLLEGAVVGFTIAEALNKDTVVVHFEKGDYRIPGIYQYINQQFAQKMLGKYKYINREQDLGIPGLRKAKESYHPVALIEKYTCMR